MAIRLPLRGIFALIIVLLPQLSPATIVQFQTPLGDFEVNLYDQQTPDTVTNFLGYVKSGAYENTIFHRSVPGFVVQGGGFRMNESDSIEAVESLATVKNEPLFSNVRGTIAMAKLGNDPDSATNQWFFSLADNSANLDNQNGGFTVFGEVMGEGMDVIDAFAALPRFNMGGALSNTPLRNFTSENAKAGDELSEDNWAFITNIVVLDATVDTATPMTPAPPKPSEPAKPQTTKKKKKGGAIDPSIILGFLLLLIIPLRCLKRRNA